MRNGVPDWELMWFLPCLQGPAAAAKNSAAAAKPSAGAKKSAAAAKPSAAAKRTSGELHNRHSNVGWRALATPYLLPSCASVALQSR